MNKLINMDKKYKTRDGRDVRVLCVDRAHPTYPVMALVHSSSGIEEYNSYTQNGQLVRQETDDEDLIEQPEEHTIDVWAVVYEDSKTDKIEKRVFDTVLDAKSYAHHRGFGIKAVKKFTLTVAEGGME